MRDHFRVRWGIDQDMEQDRGKKYRLFTVYFGKSRRRLSKIPEALGLMKIFQEMIVTLLPYSPHKPSFPKELKISGRMQISSLEAERILLPGIIRQIEKRHYDQNGYSPTDEANHEDHLAFLLLREVFPGSLGMVSR